MHGWDFASNTVSSSGHHGTKESPAKSNQTNPKVINMELDLFKNKEGLGDMTSLSNPKP